MNRVAAGAVLLVMLASPLGAAFGVSNIVSGEIVREEVPVLAPDPAPEKIAPVQEKRAACEKTVYYPYTIHLSSWQDMAIARAEAEKIAKALQPVFVTTIDLGDRGVWHRVDYGIFPSSKDAFARLAEIGKIKGVEKGAFVGEKVPFTIEVAQADSAAEASRLEAVFQGRGVMVYSINEGKDCFRIVTGAYPSPAGANRAYTDLANVGIEGRIARR